MDPLKRTIPDRQATQWNNPAVLITHSLLREESAGILSQTHTYATQLTYSSLFLALGLLSQKNHKTEGNMKQPQQQHLILKFTSFL